MPRLIISLTSYPKRITTVHQTIRSLINQTIKPYKIILWLAKEQFTNENDIPKELLELVGENFEICWCDDLKSHKKYYYSFLQYPQDCIVTFDDDSIYPDFLLEKLYNSYLKFPNAVSAIRARIIEWDEHGNLEQYDKWMHADINSIGIPAMDLLPIGSGGVLYPPNIINNEVFNKEYILNQCLDADDLWLKVMHAINKVPTVLVSEYFFIDTIEGTQENALWLKNYSGNNDRVMRQILNDYNDFRDDGLLLKDILQGKCGVSLGKEIKQKKVNERRKIYQLLAKHKNVIIYGAGYFGNKIYEVIKGLDDINILCFAVTDIKGNPEKQYELPVYEIDKLQQYGSNCIVLVATDEKYHHEITTTLQKYNFKNHFLINDSIIKVMKI